MPNFGSRHAFILVICIFQLLANKIVTEDHSPKNSNFQLLLLSGREFGIVEIFIPEEPWPIDGVKKHEKRGHDSAASFLYILKGPFRSRRWINQLLFALIRSGRGSNACKATLTNGSGKAAGSGGSANSTSRVTVEC